MNGEIASELAHLQNIPIQPLIIELDEDIAVTDSRLWRSWDDFVNQESGLGE
ncbi:hypothetical protein NG793_23645 [Laspinema sp. C5]|nr:hypothetical protein [Laspinema sp. D3d]MCT7996675.1 hypothetical protein [Laspinema sp. D3c]